MKALTRSIIDRRIVQIEKAFSDGYAHRKSALESPRLTILGRRWLLSFSALLVPLGLEFLFVDFSVFFWFLYAGFTATGLIILLRETSNVVREELNRRPTEF